MHKKTVYLELQMSKMHIVFKRFFAFIANCTKNIYNIIGIKLFCTIVILITIR